MIEAGEPRDLAALVVPRVGRMESADNPWEPWRLRDPAGAVLARRLKAKADQVWLFTRDFAVPWTSSASEQAINGPKRHRPVSGYWHALATLARYCRTHPPDPEQLQPRIRGPRRPHHPPLRPPPARRPDA